MKCFDCAQHLFKLLSVAEGIYDITTSPRAGLNRWPRPYQGRALPTELQGQYIRPPAA